MAQFEGYQIIRVVPGPRAEVTATPLSDAFIREQIETLRDFCVFEDCTDPDAESKVRKILASFPSQEKAEQRLRALKTFDLLVEEFIAKWGEAAGVA